MRTNDFTQLPWHESTLTSNIWPLKEIKYAWNKKEQLPDQDQPPSQDHLPNQDQLPDQDQPPSQDQLPNQDQPPDQENLKDNLDLGQDDDP